MSRNTDRMSTGIAILCTVGILLFIGWLIDLGTPKCSKSGCDNDAKEGSKFCWLHDNTSYSYKNSRKSSSGSSSSSSTTKSSTTTGAKSYGTTSGSSSKKKYSSSDSYDDGYNAVYEDDDYDWDRYWRDDDYAAGVDDAMEDEDW